MMDDASLDRLLAGDLGHLPSLPKRVVRLFISSTFTDMTLERNSLMERVYPRLKKYCRERHGLDFQVVDMRWGVRDEATDDHQTVNLCSREIDNCQRLSLGPNFVALIGDKYGFRPLLNRIKSLEYRSLRRCLIESDINTDFLDTWYKEDLNAVPAEYLLQPISSILKNFTNKAEPELQMVDQKIWQAIQERLHDLLLIGSGRLVRQGRMSERERALKYSISVTEREVLEGCLELSETKSHCLVYVRSIVDLRDQLARHFADSAKLASSDDSATTPTTTTTTGKQPRQLECPSSPNGSNSGDSVASGSGGGSSRRDSANRKASLKIGEDTISLATGGAQTSAERKLARQRRLMGKFIDLTAKDGGAWQIDEDAQEALGHLKGVKLREKLGSTRRNLTVYEVHWNDQDGVSAKSEEHKQYLNELTEHFYHNLVRMIRNAVKSERKVKTSGLVGEVLQHSHYSLQVAAKVHGRSGELEQVRAYVQTGSCRAPSTTGASGPLSVIGGGRKQPVPVLPMFLYGVSGSGKTSVLARVASLASEWAKQASLHRRRSSASLNNSGRDETAAAAAPYRWDRVPCIITRFCCTTPASCSIVGMLTSVCRQLQYNFYQYGPLNGLLEGRQQQQTGGAHRDQLAYQRIPEDFVRLVHTFRQLLSNCRHSLHRRRVFVIIIDSVERLLAPAECSLEAKYSWLTSLARLPPNVRLIVSCGSSPSAANSHANAPDDDCLHLKRHFLQAYYKLQEGADLAGSRPDSSASFELDSSDADLSSASESATETSSELADQTRGGGGGGDHTRPAIAQSSAPKYQLLRRLILPATRLARGSKSFTFEEGEAIAEGAGGGQAARHSPAIVRFGPAAGGFARGQGDAAGRESLLASSNSSHSDNSQAASKHKQRLAGPGATFTGAGLLHVRPLGAHLGQAVLRHWLAEAGRNLSQQQWSIVNKSLAGCSRPIFVKLALGEVTNWKSYSMQGDTKGLTFGSAWLDDFGAGERSLCPELERMCRASPEDGDGQERARLAWQMLCMEQQWLNYLEYHSRKADTQTAAASQSTGERQSGTPANGRDLVIRVGGQTGDARGLTRGSPTRGSNVLLSARSMGASAAGGGGLSSLSICHLSDTIEDAICQLFARIELQHGYLLTKHSLSYITAARAGICENELEDILSLDDVVLDDVFQYHLPPVRRIPPLLWTRVRNDLPDYLSERDSDGIVVAWHHDQFKSVTQRRYLADDSQLVYIHSLLADYFIGKWADTPKPFRCTRQQAQLAAEQLESAVQQSMRRDSDQAAAGARGSRSSLTGRLGSGSATGGHGRAGTSFSVRNRLRSSDQHDQRLQWMQAKALRRVPHQPIYYESSSVASNATGEAGPRLGQASRPASEAGASENKTGSRGESLGHSEQQRADSGPVKRRYNLRKLTELPYHLMRSGRFLDLARLVLFNYCWLFASIDALGLQSLFCDLDGARHHLELELARRRRGRSKTSAANGQPVENDDDGEEEEEEEDGADKLMALARQPETRLAAGGGPLDQAAELAVASRDNLTAAALTSLVRQVTMLSDTLRLSSSVIHSQPQMLAAQLIGRLSPAVTGAANQTVREHEGGQPKANAQSTSSCNLTRVRKAKIDADSDLAIGNFLGKLLEQCYREGASDCALLPVGHCLCTADGLKLSSLEGHPFGVTAMALASDKRHLLAVSSKFIMWNVSTGEIARDIEPRLSGSVLRGLVMCENNQFALAYSSDNTVLALEVLTQQVARLDLKRATMMSCGGEENEGDQIAGLELIDRREARRFFVWTRNGRLVIMRLEDESQRGGNPSGGSPTSSNQDRPSESEFCIAIEYQIDQVMRLCNSNSWNLKADKSRLLEVAVSEIEPGKSDLIFLTQADESCDGEATKIRLETLRISLNSRGGAGGGQPEGVEIWTTSGPAQLRQVSALALSRPSMSQLVLADSCGNICLRRRRATKWSAPKLLARASSFGREDSAVPLALELESVGVETSASDDNSGAVSDQIGRQLRKRLAEFEAKIDGDCEEIRGVSRSVFGRSLHADIGTSTHAKKAAKSCPRAHSDQVNFVKMYLPSCIAIVRLDSRLESAPYQRRCLMLPRDIRNVRLEPNKSQLMSKITLHPGDHLGSGRGPAPATQRHYLAVAANRKLLIYSIESEQLLKCYDAHSKRITALLAITQTVVSTNPPSDNGAVSKNSSSASTQQFSNALATCSLDRSVNIWNLQNVNKEERQIDRLGQSRASSASNNLQFDAVQVNSQLPLAACLSRGQLSLWEWPTSRLVLAFDSTDDLATGEQIRHTGEQSRKTSGMSTFTKAKFSASGRYLALASTMPSLQLLACEGPLAADGSPGLRRGPTSDTPIAIKPAASQSRLRGPVRSLDFFARDSRLLVVTECLTDDLDGPEDSPSEPTDELASTTIGTSENEDEEENDNEAAQELELFDRVSISCLAVPEMRPVYSFESLVPRHRGSMQATQHHSSAYFKQHARRSRAMGNKLAIGQQVATPATSANQKNRMASLTSDQQLIVVAEAKPMDSSHSPDQRKLARRRSSALSRPQIALNLYASRDGKFVASIDLSQLQTLEPQPPVGSNLPPVRINGEQAPNRLAGIATPEQRYTSRPPVGGSQCIAIKRTQFNRLKAIKNRERQSLVALIDDQQGASFIIDINSKLLVACPSTWTGKLTSDGRYGLSRMFASTGSVGRGRALAMGMTHDDEIGKLESVAGIKLLEMRHCRPLKSLLTLDQLNALNKSSGLDRTTTTGHSDTLCGFTRPNDAYVYFCDLRQRRLLLIRTRDSQLIANYKLSTPISHLKCSGDGYALILAQTDGSLIPLAIVDPQSSDAQNRLQSHLARRRHHLSTLPPSHRCA